MKIKNSHLIILSLLLFILYLFSFLSSDTESRKVIKTALINPKYKAEISQIELGNQASKVILIKKNDFWFVKTSPETSDYIPAEQEPVELLLNELVKIRKLYKISDKMPEKNHFGLEKENCFYIKTSYNDSFSEFYFGNQDFSEIFRYFMTGRNTKVYQIGSSFEPLLTASDNFWCQKTIISKDLLKISSNDDIQNVRINGKKISSQNPEFSSYVQTLLELRHGGPLYSIAGNKEKVLSGPADADIFLELGNKKSISLKAYKLSSEPEEAALIVNYDNSGLLCAFKISGWTLSKLLNN